MPTFAGQASNKIDELMKFVSYAQNFEDVILWRALKTPSNGFYIDVGANHPRVDSVTKAFYDRGWRGINIEPLDGLWQHLEVERPGDVNLRLIVANAPSTTTFYEVENSGLSTTEPEIAERHRKAGIAVKELSVAADTLANICAAHVKGEIHFLKIDVEGGTRSVLEGADFRRFRPWIILIEATQPLSQTEDYADWEFLITDYGYEFVYADGLNRFYLALERAYLGTHFRYPPNVFDDFVSHHAQVAPVPEPPTAEVVPANLEARRSLFRLVSFHDTVVYLDEASKQLRHGPQSQVPNNLLLERVGTRGHFYVLGTRFGEICNIETFIARQVAQFGVGRGHQSLEIGQLDDAKIFIKFDGKFLSCTPDGIGSFDRDWCQGWEMISLQPASTSAFFLATDDAARFAGSLLASRSSDKTPSVPQHLAFLISGPFESNWSLATVNRRLALQLEQSYPGAVHVIPDDLPLDERQAAVAELLERPARPGSRKDAEIVIHQRWPVTAPSQKGDLTLAYFFWEESRIPHDIIEVLNTFDGVLASAESVAYALNNSGLEKPAISVGYSPSLEPFERLREDHESGAKARPFTFLHISRCYPRKGVDVLLRAYAKAFHAGDDVRLIIKGPRAFAASQLEVIQAETPDMCPVIIMDEDLDLSGMLELYRAADVMVLPARGEGFNIPAAEAIAAGLKLIVTGFGGHMQFCREGVARLVDYTLVRSNSYENVPESLWAEPHLNDLCSALREAHDGNMRIDDLVRREVLAQLTGDAWIERIADAVKRVSLQTSDT